MPLRICLFYTRRKTAVLVYLGIRWRVRAGIDLWLCSRRMAIRVGRSNMVARCPAPMVLCCHASLRALKVRQASPKVYGRAHACDAGRDSADGDGAAAHGEARGAWRAYY